MAQDWIIDGKTFVLRRPDRPDVDLSEIDTSVRLRVEGFPNNTLPPGVHFDITIEPEGEELTVYLIIANDRLEIAYRGEFPTQMRWTTLPSVIDRVVIEDPSAFVANMLTMKEWAHPGEALFHYLVAALRPEMELVIKWIPGEGVIFALTYGSYYDEIAFKQGALEQLTFKHPDLALPPASEEEGEG